MVPSEMPLWWGMIYCAAYDIHRQLCIIKRKLEGKVELRITKAMFSVRRRASSLAFPRIVPMLVSHSAAWG